MAVSDTIRGFRTQFLYTIHRVIYDCNSDLLYAPEGIEDLDIKKNGIVIETIQIKNYNKKIQPSDLTSPAGTTSFFKRAINTLSKNKNACIHFVSFGEVGNYLQNTSSLKEFLKQNKKDKELRNNAKLLSLQYKLSVVDESTLYNEISTKLKVQFPAFNPDKEIKYMLQWVSEKAENHNDFTYEEFIKELQCYQAFENRQKAALSELGIRIIPLFDQSLHLDTNVLKQQFYSGISASSCHIANDLDIIRPEKNIAIHNAFKEKNVVIINGASGQGKSTLAYRYIKDNCALAFEIMYCDMYSLSNLRATLTELCTGLTVPVTLYFDAKPADDSWILLVKTFSVVKNVRCLISLRNEDWNQYRSRLGSEVMYKDIELTLNKSEAQLIYKALCQHNKKIIVDFESSWDKLGNNVPLLEFVYFITQGQALKDKLASQWNLLSQNEKTVFEKIITVNFFGGKIKRRSKVLLEHGSYSNVQNAIEKYIGEFFVENTNGFLSEVHPIRTKILIESIYGNDSDIMIENALSFYFKSEINDAHLYLLNLYREGMATNQLISFATNEPILPAKQFAGIVRALIWKGTEEYFSENRPLIDLLKEKSGPLWEFHLPVNFTEINIKQSLVNLLKYCHEAHDVSNIVDSFPSQYQIFRSLNNFISNKLTVSCSSSSDWITLSDALYRISLGHSSPCIKLKGEIESALLTTAEISSILLGLKSLKIKEDCWGALEKIFIKKLRIEQLITNFFISDRSIEATCYLDYIGGNDCLTNHQLKDYSTNSYLVRIINLLRRAFPDKESYHVKLGKDDLSDMIIDSEKNILKSNLPIDAMYEIRACIVNQYKNKIGIPDKKNYASRLMLMRKEIVIANQRLINEIATFLKKGKFNLEKLDEAYKLCISSTSKEIPELSFILSNEFGYGITDSSDCGKNSSWDVFAKSIKDYVSNLLGFYHQIPTVLLKKDSNKMPSKACLLETLIATKMMQTKFKEKLSDYFSDKQEIALLDEKEYNSILSLWVLWETLCRNITNVTIESQMARYKQLETNLPQNIVNSIKNDFFNEGINCTINKEKQNLNIVIEFHDIEEYNKACICIDDILRDALVKYDVYTSQEYILRQSITTISVQFLYIEKNGNKHRISSIVRNYNVQHLLRTKVNDNSFYPKYISEKQGTVNAKLLYYEDIMSLATSILFIGHQIIKMNQAVLNTDDLGQQVINLYIKRCLTEFKKYKSMICLLKNRLSKLNNLPFLDELHNLIRVIEYIYNSECWINFMDELDNVMQSIFNRDMEIRLYLLEN